MQYSNLITFLEEERRRQNITRKKLEELSGVSASTVTKWTRGEAKPQLEPFVEVMRALGFEIGLRRIRDGAKSKR